MRIVPRLYRFFCALATLAALLPLSACSQPEGEKKPQEVVVKKPQYTLRTGKTVIHPYPLPSLTPIYIEKTSSQGELSSQLGFRAWDFNQDKRYDLVEVLDEKGRLTTRLYDLNLDGIVDFQSQMDLGPLPSPGH